MGLPPAIDTGGLCMVGAMVGIEAQRCISRCFRRAGFAQRDNLASDAVSDAQVLRCQSTMRMSCVWHGLRQ
jgi:hypothetical protein